MAVVKVEGFADLDEMFQKLGDVPFDVTARALDAMAEELRPEVKRDYERVGSSLKSWENSIADLRSMIDDKDWEQANIDGLCSAFELDTAERTKYFGPIDKLAAEKAVIESES